MKNMLRLDTVHKTCLTTTKAIKTPTDVREHLSARFSTEAWQNDHKCGAINRIEILEATLGAIERPRIEEEFESIPGLRKSFGFLSISDGRVNHREFDCWCHSCIMAGGHSLGTMDCDSIISTCINAGKKAHKWYQCDVARKDVCGVAGRRVSAQHEGHKLVARLNPGSYVAVQNREVNNTDPYWVGITLDSGDGTCVIKKNLGRTEKIQGMTFTRGDYAVAVRWLARDDADSKRLTFLSADHDAPAAQEVFNSTELRCIDLNMTEQKCLAPAGRLTRSGRVAPREKRFVLSGEEESVILNACW
jgi:hypothetical protein